MGQASEALLQARVHEDRRKGVVDQTRTAQFVREHFEAMVFTALAEELRRPTAHSRAPALKALVRSGVGPYLAAGDKRPT